MRGKLGEDLKIQIAHAAGAFTATSMTFGRGSIDTQGFKEALIVVNLGDVIGSSTFACKVYENSADDFTTAIPVTGGTLASSNSSSTDQTSILGNILVANYKRYIWVGAMASGTYGSSATQSVNFGATVILGKGISDPQSNTLEIDLEG